MAHALLLLAAEEASEPSKVPFFIAGGVFVVWAMTLFLVGMRNDSFPGGQAAARGVMAVSVVLMAAAMATAVVTA
jgi:hypothetical protein